MLNLFTKGIIKFLNNPNSNYEYGILIFDLINIGFYNPIDK